MSARMSAFKFEWVAQYLHREPTVIIDAGCYDGTDAIAFKEEWPAAEVHAFEACPDNFARMQMLGLAAASGVNTYHAAVCDHEDGCEFNSNTDTNQVAHFGQSGSILAPTPKLIATWPSIAFKAPRRVPSVRLDLFCQREQIDVIDVLHMDVQGAEYFVLLGLGAMRPAMIYLETNETADEGRYVNAVPKDDIKAWFLKNGYSRKWEGEFDALYVHERN